MLIRNVEIPGFVGGRPGPLDVRLSKRIDAIGKVQPIPGETVIEGYGGALLPGLHDHHIHLFGLAAASASVDCGPDQPLDEMVTALRAATSDWVRGINYHESLAGELTAADIDKWVSERPVRIQHRSGIVWYLNSAALREVGAHDADLPGIERGADGRPNGRLFRMDAWLGERTPSRMPELAPVTLALAGHGVTGVTDATHTNDAVRFTALADRFQAGALLQTVRVMTGPPVSNTGLGVLVGEHKIMLDEYQLPDFDALVARIRRAHDDESRGVAIHCVTRIEYLLAMAALREAGASRADRLEHASVVPAESIAELAALDVTVVSQPSLVFTRGDRYRADVAEAEHPDLYRTATLTAAGIRWAASSDAPYGDANPWLSAHAAVMRRTSTGAALGLAEAQTPEAAVSGYLGSAADPGTVRRLNVGAAADVCLLDRSWARARQQLADVRPVLTVRGGEIIFATD